MFDIIRHMKVPIPRTESQKEKRFIVFWRILIPIYERTMMSILKWIGLLMVRAYIAKFEYPTYTPQENPVITHPSTFVRVSQFTHRIYCIND